MQDLLFASVGYGNRLTLFVAVAAFGRTLAALGVAILAKGMSFFFVELDFARFGVTVADFAIFQGFTMSFVVEADIAVFGFEHDGVGSKSGAGSEGDEHGSNNEVFHDGFSCVLVKESAEYPL